MLTDPTGGVGYAFGEVLSSTHMTTIATNQPKAVDGAGGGSYTLSAELRFLGAQFFKVTSFEALAGGVVNFNVAPQFNNGAAFNSPGVLVLGGSLVMSGTAAIMHWRTGVLADAPAGDKTITNPDRDIYLVEAPSVATILSLDNPPGATEGVVILFVRAPTVATALILRRTGAGGNYIITLNSNNADRNWAEVVFTGGVWRLGRHSTANTTIGPHA